MPPCEQMAYQKTKPHAHAPAQVHTVEVHTFRFSNKTILPNCPWHVAERQDKEQEAERRRQTIKHPCWPAQPTALDNELRPLVWPQRSRRLDLSQFSAQKECFLVRSRQQDNIKDGLLGSDTGFTF